MALGGDLKIITAANQKLGKTFTFYPMANQDNTIILGGATVDDNEDGVAGGGAENVWMMTYKIGSLTATCANDSAVRKDIENVKELVESGEESVFTCEMADGTIYKVSGMPVGVIEANTNAATFELKINGKVERV